jgi:hypothetical protein
MLYFDVVQDVPNAVGPSPIGSCKTPGHDPDCAQAGEPACPANQFQNPFPDCSCSTNNLCPLHASNLPASAKENYYACPPQGCIIYAVKVNDPAYHPGPTSCDPYLNPAVVQAMQPAGDNVLRDLSTHAEIEQTEVADPPTVPPPPGSDAVYPHHVGSPIQDCKVDGPAKIPPWKEGGAAPPAIGSFQVVGLPKMQVSVKDLTSNASLDVFPVNQDGSNVILFGLTLGHSFQIDVTASGRSCTGKFDTTGTPAEPKYSNGSGCGISPPSGTERFTIGL